MATLNTSKIHRFNLFGYNFMIWKSPVTKQGSGGGMANGSCKLVRHHNHIALAMPDGKIIPHQVDLEIKAPLNAIATAKIEVFVSID
jgi:hypothetical protein